MEKKRVIYLDLLRLVAIYFMMMIHIAGGYASSTKVLTGNWIIANLYECCVRCCIPLFFMISGVFFLNPEKNYTFERLLKNNIKRIVCAFVFWSAIYAIYSCIADDNHSITHMIKTVIQQISTGHYHLWFLFTLVGIYLVVPILRKISEDENILKGSLGIGIIFVFILPFLVDLSERYTSILKDDFDNVNYGFLGGYVLFFMIGYYLYIKPISVKAEIMIYVLGVLGAVFGFGATWYIAYKTGDYSQKYYAYITWNVLVEAVAMFVLFKNKISKIKLSAKAIKVVNVISALSFGMYLVHDFFNGIFVNMGGLDWSRGLIIIIPIVTACVFIFSFGVIWLLSKVPILKKYIM